MSMTGLWRRSLGGARTWPWLVVLLTGLLLLAGCGLHVDVPPARERGQWPEHRPVPSYYRVVSGDTLYAIAFRYRLDHHDLAHWNDIDPPYVINPDDRLRLRPPFGQRPRLERSERTASTSRPLPPRQAPGKPRHQSSNGGSADPPAASQPSTRNESSSGSSPATTPPAASQAAVSSGGWRWPVPGPVIRPFGASGAGRRGMDIGGEEGAAVRASRGGEVVYSGNGLVGYGELIIIKHDGRYLSAYGFNQARLVEEGERVDSGQVIARMGTGPDNKPMLHFEVRDRGQPLNPVKVLPSR